MKYRPLGDSGIDVSLICLGSMTWREQNSQQEACEQMDFALDQGVNFWDTAEMYPIPVNERTAGATEEHMGYWFGKSGRRSEVVLATKVTGRSNRSWIRGGKETRLSREQIFEAVDGSLKRLKTDYIDLYQLHWPDRRLGLWGEGGGSYVHKENEDEISLAESLDAMSELVRAGKIRTIGLSNETPWGLGQYLAHAGKTGGPRVVSVQNSYSLLNRIYEIGLSEFSYREKVGLLAYSPLAMGALSGKYVGGEIPENSRLALFPDFMTRYRTAQVEQAISEYSNLAARYSLTTTELALGFVNTRPFVTSSIIGATTITQLGENIRTVEVAISDELEEEIRAIHVKYKHPAAA